MKLELLAFAKPANDEGGCNFPVPSALHHSSVVTLYFNFFLPLQDFYLMLKLMLNSNDHTAVISVL